MKNPRLENINIKKVSLGDCIMVTDQVAVEEPLGIVLEYSTANGRMQKNVSVTMRTPGNDEELAAGFLFTEGIITNPSGIKSIHHTAADENKIIVTLHENIFPAFNNTERNFYSTSSCGICGKASIDAIRTGSAYQNEKDDIVIEAGHLYGLQDSLRQQQQVFENTGGIHASALFNKEANLVDLREDVGRHNALDKLIGTALLQNKLPLINEILLLSGRASFELVQKAAMAGIRIIVAVGAPSSLAVELAEEHDITLIGFLRNNRFNIYSGYQRIIL